jgi:hypothetical protein
MSGWNSFLWNFFDWIIMSVLPDSLVRDVSSLDYGVEKLHSRMEFLEPCCSILNKEWPRSHSARYVRPLVSPIMEWRSFVWK